MIHSFLRPTKGQKGQRGQAMILILFSIIGLIGMSALAIDGGNAFLDRRKAETAADAAALTGAITRIEGGNWRAAALASAAANGYDNNGATNTVELNTPPLNGIYAGNSEYIEVIITSRLSTYFGPVVGVPQITNVVKAVSQSKPAMYGPLLDGDAVVSLAPASDCDKHRSFWIEGEATLSITGGDVFVNSNNPTCALIENGSGSIRINDDHRIAIVGGATIQKPKLFTPYPPLTGAPPTSSPPPFLMPKVGCANKKMAEITADGHTMTSGSWDDDFPPPGVDTLQSGIYCLNKDFIVPAFQKLTGYNVVIKMEHGKLRFSGNAQINLSAPNGAGDLAGLLIYQPADNINPMSLNGNELSTFRGTILAPGAQIRINGNDSRSGFHSQIIGYTIYVTGQSNVIIAYRPDQNYHAYKMPEVLLSQ